MSALQPYLKALVGFLTPGVVVLGAAVTEASQRGDRITEAEWITALVACFVTGGLVFQVPNKDPKAEHQDESVQPPPAAGVLAVDDGEEHVWNLVEYADPEQDPE